MSIKRFTWNDFINRAPGKKIEDLKRGLPFTEDGITYFK
jgi:hypothetical protein